MDIDKATGWFKIGAAAIILIVMVILLFSNRIDFDDFMKSVMVILGMLQLVDGVRLASRDKNRAG